jgi:sulfite oxidase
VLRRVHDSDALNTGAWPTPTTELVTPTDLFFTRSHAAVPSVDLNSWRLEVDGLVDRPTEFTWETLTRLVPSREVTATLVCAGLRRDEFLALGELPGELPWGPEPISTARWSGVPLKSLLASVGVSSRARHVEFVGLDRPERHGVSFGFGGSIDIAKAMSDDVLLATHLNGSPLPPQHGFPLRTVVPGWIGARSVKWLAKITLLEEPSANYFQSKAYRLQRDPESSDRRDVSAGVPLTAVPVNSVILRPSAQEVVRAGPFTVTGWAMGSGGQAVKTVEVSRDGGAHWDPARLTRRGEQWSWSFWEAELDLLSGTNMLAVRAMDVSGATQPASVRETWNVKGYNNNAWHRVTIEAH